MIGLGDEHLPVNKRGKDTDRKPTNRDRTMAPSPTGIEICKGKRKWKVGKKLGSGACATVCELKSVDNGTCIETDYAVKLAPLAKKKTKKGNSPDEMNEKLLYYEQLVYNTQFRTLQGTFIPSIPSASSKDPPIYGDQNGYRFFVMERMDSTISSIVPLLLKNKPSSKTISIGPICVKLLECVRAVHQAKNIIRDVKTENFMLTLGSKASGSTIEKKLASRIRLIDLAIATQWTGMYCETDIGDSLVGTPLYASLNLHSGKKSSFRDDLESLGYVIAEILIQLYSGDPSKQLPWSKGKSDDDIGSMKRSLVDNENSEFFLQLGNAKTIAVFSEYMQIVRGYSFKTPPDYDRLSQILSNLTVPRTKSGTVPSDRSAPSSKKTASTKRTRSKAPRPCSDYASPPKVARRNTTRSARSMNSEERTTNELDESFDETVYADAHQDLQEMDWEYCVDENEEPKKESKPQAKTRARRDPVSRRQRSTRAGKALEEESEPLKKTRTQRDPAFRRQRTTRSGKAAEDIVIDDDSQDKTGSSIASPKRLKRSGVSIACIEGPYEGQSFDIEAGVNETLVIGSKSSSSVGEFVCLKNDRKIQATHVRLDLSINRRVTALKVTDKSKGKTFVNRQAVTSTKAFINDTIKIGDSSFKVKTL